MDISNRKIRILVFILSLLGIIYFSFRVFPDIVVFMQYVIRVFLPFIIAIIFAYLLHPMVCRLEGVGFPRMLATLVVLLGIVGGLVFVLVNITPLLISQISSLLQNLPFFTDTFESQLNALNKFLAQNNIDYSISSGDIADLFSRYFTSFSSILQSIVIKIFNSISIIFLTPIIMFYFLVDFKRIIRNSSFLLKKYNFNNVYLFLKDTDKVLSSYFKGVFLIMHLLAIASAAALYLAGLDYAIIFGFIIGYTNIIPLVGPYVGGAPAVLFALSDSWEKAVVVIVIIVVAQLLESNILTPYIQSRSVKAHPLLILFAFLLFSNLFGFLGFILAIPLLSILVLAIKYLHMYFRVNRIKRKNFD